MCAAALERVKRQDLHDTAVNGQECDADGHSQGRSNGQAHTIAPLALEDWALGLCLPGPGTGVTTQYQSQYTPIDAQILNTMAQLRLESHNTL